MSSYIGRVGNLSADQVAGVLAAAVAAPSLHNSQPWRFRCTRSTIEVYADRGRALPATDPDGRELLLACGAALCNLRIALQSIGVHPVVELAANRGIAELLPVVRRMGVDPVVQVTAARNDEDLLAVVRPAGIRPVTASDKQLAAAIRRRRTNRRPFEAAKVSGSVRLALQRAAHLEGARLAPIATPQLSALRSLVRQAHRAQLADAGFLDEWSFWTGRVDGERDGVPAGSAGPLPEGQDRWVLRDFSGGRAAARVPGKEFEEPPLIMVLESFNDIPISRLQAGQAMQRVLLTAAARGVSASFISQVTEVPSARHELRAMLGGALWPQAVLRLGYGSPAPPTPRRDLREVVDVLAEVLPGVEQLGLVEATTSG